MTQQQVDEALKLLKEGHTPKQLAEKYGVHRSVIYRRVKQPNVAKDIPVEIKNKVIKAVKEGHTKAEAAQMHGLNIGTVYQFTRGIEGYRSQGNHFIRQNGMRLLNRLMTDGCLISDFIVPTARNLQRHFPMIMSARYKDKTFFYLKGREEETIEAYFREKPDRIISYPALLEISRLLGVELSKNRKRNIVKRLKGQHEMYWKNHRLVQRKFENFEPGSPFLLRKPVKRNLKKRISKKNNNPKTG